MTYDRSIKMFDEPHSPKEIDEMVSQGVINKGKFLSAAHAGSYQYQMNTIRELNDVKSVLEIGPGEAYCARNLKELGYNYDTLDFEDTYNPTIKADFKTFDADSIQQKYDLVCAFQVLEHFPYDLFIKNIEKLCSLTNNYVFLSLPYSCRGFSINVNILNGQWMRLEKKLQFYFRTNLPNRKYRPEYMNEFPWGVHYWELGRKEFKLKKILRDIKSCGLNIERNAFGPNPYHYFILCSKR